MAENANPIGNLSVARAMKLLTFFSEKQNAWGIRELASASGYSPSSVYKFLYPLVEAGFLQKGEDEKYRLGVQFIRYANIVENSVNLIECAQGVLKDFVEREKGTVNISLYSGMHVYHKLAITYEDEVQFTPRQYESSLLPLTATGQLLLAERPREKVEVYLEQFGKSEGLYQSAEERSAFWDYLMKCRKQGYAVAYFFDRIPRLCATGVPIYNQYHTLIGAVSHYEVVGEETEGRIEMIANELKRAVEQTRMAMGWQ